MEQKETFAARQQNWAYLIFLCAVGFYLASRKTGAAICAMAYPFLGTVALTGYVLLLGWKSQTWFTSRKQTICGGLGILALGYLQKIMVYWAQVMAGKTPVFYPFSTSGMAWIPLVCGCYLIAAGLLEKKDVSQRKWLAGALALGLLGGLVRPFDSFLCLGQICAYAPFFVLGRQLKEEQVQRWTKRGRWPLALAALLAAGLGCLLLWRKLKVLWPIVDGDGWYGDCSWLTGSRLPLGIVFRLGWYAMALLLLWALFCLMPGGRIPWVTAQGEGFLSGYFWFMPLSYLTLMPLNAGMTGKRLLLAAACSLALLLAGTTRRARSFPQLVIGTPWRALSNGTAAAPLSGSSFCRRHQWAVDMIFLYTLAFAVVMVAYIYPLNSNGKSLIWVTDGIGQQFPMMFYFKEQVVEALKGLLETGQLAFPQWDFSLGFGMSPLDAVRREPFMLLALFGDEGSMEGIANLSVVLRHYVCGLSFLWLCAVRDRREKLPVLMGTLLYVFSGFAILISVRQPFFVTVLMTYLPLTLVGAERYIQHRKYGMFLFLAFLQLLSGYYSAYINGLILAVYLLVRLGFQYGKNIRAIIGTIARLLGFYAWGACAAAATLLPSIVSLLSSARTQGGKEALLFYTNGHYERMFTGLNLEFGGAGYWTYISLAAIGWLACILLLLRHKKELRPLKTGLGLVMLFVSIPIFGLIANAFSYVCNRWAYAIPLVVGLVLVEMAPEFLNLSRKDKGVLLVSVLVYCAVVVTRPAITDQIKTIGLLVLCMTALVILMQDQFLRSKRVRMGILSLVTVLTLMLNLAVSFLPGLGNYASECQDTGTAYEEMAGGMDAAVEEMDQDGFYRVGQSSSNGNQSMGVGYYGTNSYYSVNPQGISDYCTDICLSDQYQVFRIYGLDGRTVPNALASVRYFVAEKGEEVPYGYTERAVLEDGESVLYENQYALPLGYTYSSYLSREKYEKLTPLEKQQVMLEAAVLEQRTDGLEKAEPSYQEERIACTVHKLDHIELLEGDDRVYAQSDIELRVEENNSMEFRFEGKPGCETYLVLKGLRYADPYTTRGCRVICRTDDVRRETALWGKAQSYYFDRDAVVFNLGYSEEGLSKCRVSFSAALIAAYDEAYVVCVPMDGYAEQIEARTSAALENVSETGDRITGTIDLEESRLLALSIPYAPGWTAYVNGEEQELLRVNVMYCGLLLEPGSYDIELRYEQPGQKTGTIVSLLAIGAVVPVAVISARRRKKRCASES